MLFLVVIIAFGACQPTSSKTITLVNDAELYYHGVIHVGDPPVPVKVDFDTGSSNFWVYGDDCFACDYPLAYPAGSSSFATDGETVFVEYGSGQVLGYVGTDVWEMAGMSVDCGIMVTVEDSGSFKTSVYSGLVGLGFAELTEGTATTALNCLMASGQIGEASFAFYLSNSTTRTGALTFGGVDPTYFTGTMLYTPVTQDRYWQISLDSVDVYMGDKLLLALGTSLPAIVDSGTSLIVGPSASIESIVSLLNQISNTYNPDTLPLFPDLVFTVGGVQLRLSPYQYFMQNSSLCTSGTCLGLEGNDFHIANEMFILGDVFMRAYYTHFDATNNRIGFAPAIQPS